MEAAGCDVLDGFKVDAGFDQKLIKERAVPDALKASSRDAMPADDIETAYRLYLEEISQA
jgi:hypothetical protein